MRALAVVSAALTLGVTTQAWSQHRAPPARDRPAPVAVLVNIGQCNGVLNNFEKRRACRACVTRGGRFHTQGHGPGRCEMPPPPPPPRPPFAVNGDQCNSFVGHPGKRARCHGCVGRGGKFHLRGPGRCELPPPPPPPPAPPVLQSVDECNAHVIRPPKRARCVHCVTHGGRFHRHGAALGRCEMPPPPPRPPFAVNGDQCNAFAGHPGKRARCHGCVSRGGRFHLHGPGRCEMPPPPPPPPPHRHVIVSVPDCNHQLPHKHIRKECKRCVKRGGRFHVMDRTCHF